MTLGCTWTPLRRSLGSVCFVPIALVRTEPQAYAIESVLIASVSPGANRAAELSDAQRRSVGIAVRPSELKRHRPPKGMGEAS